MNTKDPAHSPTGSWDADGTANDRDILFAQFAVFAGLVDDDTVEDACRQIDESKSLPDVLFECGAISADDRAAIDFLVDRRIEKNADDPQMIGLSSATASLADAYDSATILSATAGPGRAQSPKFFGDYEILEPIAEGGMGVVYKARQAKLNRLVALKMIRSCELADEAQIERFYSEAQAAAKLDHPGIVPVHEVGQQNGQHFFSMAFVDGMSLHEWVNNGGLLRPTRAAELMKTIAEAVQFGHEKGIVHRDIKPHNILLDETESPRVTDFGLAKHGDSEMTVAGQVMGTPSYMPPEQAEGRPEAIGVVSDVYSLGATLYYVLTGRPPFQAAAPTETLRQVINDDPVPPRTLNPDIPRNLETICLKCLRKQPAGRYASAQEFADDLARWLENRPIVARRVTAIEKTWLWCRRRPVILGAGMAILFAAAVFAGLAAAEQRRNLRDRVRTTVNSISTTRGVILPPLKDLDEFPREMVLAELREQFEDTTDGRKLPLAYALAYYGDVRAEFLVSQVARASPDEVDNLVAALGKSKAESIAALKKAARAAERQKNWRHKARLALLASYLEAHSLAEEMCRLQPYPQRTWFIEECSTWHGDLSKLLQLAADSDNGPLRASLVLAAGSAPESDVSAVTKQRWERSLTSWYQSRPDALTHSASAWCIQNWKLSLPEIASSKSPLGGMDWHVNGAGMTMLKIPAGRFVRRNTSLPPHIKAIEQTVTLTRSFLLADSEVTRGQFQQFINDSDYPNTEKPSNWPEERSRRSPTERHPVTWVKWYDAVLFCNWLSKKEGLTPCYERTGEKETIYVFQGKRKKREYDVWRLVPSANGYRLPTEAEWEYACRAGTRTRFSHGDDESLLDRYAVYRASRTEVGRSRLPNARGLFDVHGNVWEFCTDRYRRPFGFGNEDSVTDPIGTERGLIRAFRGGSFNFLARNAGSGFRLTNNPVYMGEHLGFRVARTYP